MLTHLCLELLKNILCVLHDHLTNELANLFFERIFELIRALFINDALDRRPSYIIHILNTSSLINLKQLKAELKNSLILSHISFEWYLLEDGIDHGPVVFWSVGWCKGHVLEFDNTAGSSHDVILGINL
jgi:hypothetical protein